MSLIFPDPKDQCPHAEVDTTFSCSHIAPYPPNEKDQLAAKRIDALLNRLFIEPVLGLGFPVQDLKFLEDTLFHMLKKFDAYPRINKIYVTENGAAFWDILENGEVNDAQRVHFLKRHIQAMLKAKNEGVNVKGYFVWTFTDNFEWAEGFHPHFGLVYVDFKTQQRTVKSSGIWYKPEFDFKILQFG